MSISQCSFDVLSDIRSLVEAKDQQQQPGDVVVAYDGWAGSAAKRFARVKCDVKDGQHECSFADLVALLTRHDDHKYEVINKDEPARLFFDVEWPDDGQVKAADPLTTLLSALDLYCYGSTVFAKRVVLSCLRPNSKKRSFRVVFRDAVFRSVCGDMKTFVLGFVRWLLEEHESGASLTYEKKLKNGKVVPMTVVVTAAYTSNRNLRMLGQSEATDETRTPMSMEDDAATDAMVQHARWIRASAETSADIDSVVEKRRPADHASPALQQKQKRLMQRRLDFQRRSHPGLLSSSSSSSNDQLDQSSNSAH